MTNKINGIDVSEYFIEVVDEGGGTIDYKVLPNSERLLVKKIFEQNQQLKRLQEENEKLKANKGRCAFKCLDNTFCGKAKIQIDKLKLDKDCLNASLETARKYRGIAEVDRDKYKQALEDTLKILCNGRTFYEGYFDNPNLSRTDEAIKVIDEVLK